MQNQRLLKERDLMQSKLKKLIREDKKKELDRRAQMEREEDEDEDDDDEEHNGNSEALQRNILDMLMRAQMQDHVMQSNMEQQREQEMIEKAIQESLKENPNPDVMNYEQLQELEERIGSVSKGFSDAEISLIPKMVCNSTKEDCSVCLDKIKIGEEIKRLNCGHEFHSDCINECFKNTKKCPYCMDEHQLDG